MEKNFTVSNDSTRGASFDVVKNTCSIVSKSNAGRTIGMIVTTMRLLPSPFGRGVGGEGARWCIVIVLRSLTNALTPGPSPKGRGEEDQRSSVTGSTWRKLRNANRPDAIAIVNVITTAPIWSQ